MTQTAIVRYTHPSSYLCACEIEATYSASPHRSLYLPTVAVAMSRIPAELCSRNSMPFKPPQTGVLDELLVTRRVTTKYARLHNSLGANPSLASQGWGVVTVENKGSCSNLGDIDHSYCMVGVGQFTKIDSVKSDSTRRYPFSEGLD